LVGAIFIIYYVDKGKQMWQINFSKNVPGGLSGFSKFLQHHSSYSAWKEFYKVSD
jgi:hypothetical protein